MRQIGDRTYGNEDWHKWCARIDRALMIKKLLSDLSEAEAAATALLAYEMLDDDRMIEEACA